MLTTKFRIGVLRFLVEFVRFHDTSSNPLVGPFSVEQWISLMLATLGLACLLYACTHTKPTPKAFDPGP